MAFADRGLEFLLDFGLRLAQHVLDDALSALRVIACGVTAFPSAVLSFSDIAFSVCSSFWHGIDLLCNGKPYRKRQRKAIKKRNRYQKVIICPSEPRRLIFAYCGAISAPPGNALLWLVQNKHSTRSVYEASEAMLIFVIMGGQWMDGFFDEPSVRAVNSPPPSCYKDSIEQVAPAMPRARHEPI